MIYNFSLTKTHINYFVKLYIAFLCIPFLFKCIKFHGSNLHFRKSKRRALSWSATWRIMKLYSTRQFQMHYIFLLTKRCYFNEREGVWNLWFLLDSTAFMTFYIHVLWCSFIKTDLANLSDTLVCAIITLGHWQKTKR